MHNGRRKAGWVTGALGALTVLMTAGTAQAQFGTLRETTAQASPAGDTTAARPAIRLGFSKGDAFGNGATRVHLEGFEAGADIPLRPHAGTNGGVYFSPTATFGGSNRHGSDTDGNVFRLLVSVKYALTRSGLYGGGGLGYAFTQARVHEFHNVSGLAAEALLGYDLSMDPSRRTRPFLEATYHAGANAQLRGFSVDVGLRL